VIVKNEKGDLVDRTRGDWVWRYPGK